MDVQEQIKLNFEGVNIVKVDFESLTVPSVETKVEVEIGVTPKVFYPESEPRRFKILMECNASCESYFNLKVNAVGDFTISRVIDEDLKTNFVNVNAPAIMFPLVRAFIMTLSANLGNSTPTIKVPPQMFSGLLSEVETV